MVKVKKYTKEELDEILEKHKKWLNDDEEEGERANLRYADLSYADLRFAELSSADLSSADLSYANLRSADLNSANLRSADLSSANLNSANLDLKFISLNRIGSRREMTTYCFDNDTIWCGCFKGTLEEFEKKVNKTHKDNKQHLKEYTGAINYIKFLKEV